MIYGIIEYLRNRGIDIPGGGMFQYVTFRSIFALVVSIIVASWFGSHFIDILKKRNISETQRDPKLDPFGVEKKGVPTLLLPKQMLERVGIDQDVLFVGMEQNIEIWSMKTVGQEGCQVFLSDEEFAESLKQFMTE